MKGEHTGGLSHREIAKLLGISHGTVVNIEKRAIAKMIKLAKSGPFADEIQNTTPSNGTDKGEKR